MDKLYVPKEIFLVPTVPKRELLVVLPYLRTFSLSLRKRLYKSVSKSLPQCNIKVILSPKIDIVAYIFGSTLSAKFVVVISIILTTYYCETKRRFKVRTGEHISTFPLTGKRVNKNKKSSFKNHCLLSGYVCSFEEIPAVNYESQKVKLLFKESLFVTKDKPLLNKN